MSGDSTVSGLPAVTSIDGTELVYVVQGGGNNKATTGQIAGIPLSTNLNLYVDPSTGSDSNNGLTVGSPFATIGWAWTVANNSYRMQGQTITINLAAGTYAGFTAYQGPFNAGATASGSGYFIINGAGNTTILTGLQYLYFTDVVFQNVQFQNQVYCDAQSYVIIQNVKFGAGSSISGRVGAIFLQGNVEVVSGVSDPFIQSNLPGVNLEWSSGTLTLTGTPSFTTGFIQVGLNSCVRFYPSTITGTATGKQYDVLPNGILDTNGSGGTNVPGTAASGTVVNYGKVL